jgi:HK97 family phage portal protein
MPAAIPGDQKRATPLNLATSLMRTLDYGADGRLRNAYLQSVSVYRCVNLRADAIAQAPFALYRGQDKVEDHPLLDILRNPNPLQTEADFKQTLVTHLLLAGNAYPYVDQVDSRGMPRQIVPLVPNSMEPDRPTTNLYDLRGWIYTPPGGGGRVSLSVDEVVHIRHSVAPDDPVIGVGPLHAARVVIETDFLASVYNRAVLRNSGAPAGILKWKGQGRADEEELKAIRRDWVSRFGGPLNAESIAALGSDFEYQAIGQSGKDMRFREMHDVYLHDIARAFDVPMVLLGEYSGGGFDGGGFRAQRRLFWQGPVRADGDRIVKALQRRIIDPVDPGLQLVLDWDSVDGMREDLRDTVTIAQTLKELGWSRNQINDWLDMGGPVDERGDVVLVPMGMATVESVVEASGLPPLDVTPPVEVKPLPPPVEVVVEDTAVPDPAVPAQATASMALEIVKSVATHQIPRDTGLGMLATLCGIDQDAAERMLGSAGTVTRATDFPTKGDDLAVGLKNSQFEQFDHAWAEALKADYPAIWDAGGNIRGDDAYLLWTKVRENGGVPETSAQEDWVREREAWMARHEGDGAQFSDETLSPTLSNVAGVVAVIKWGGVCTIGEPRMKAVLNELKRKRDGEGRSLREAAPPSVMPGPVRPARLAALSDAYVRALAPMERSALARIRRYLIEQRAAVLAALDGRTERSLERAPKKPKKPGEDKPIPPGVIDDAVSAMSPAAEFLIRIKPIIDAAAERGIRMSVNDLVNFGVIDTAASEFQLSRPEINRIVSQYYDSRIDVLVSVNDTIRSQVNSTLMEGWANGENLSDLKDRVRSVFNASASRARTIARTEVSNAVNGGRYQTLGDNGVKTIEWIATLDGHARDSHAERDGEVIDFGSTFSGPGDLRYPGDTGGPPEEVINCRCTFASAYRPDAAQPSTVE